MKGIKPGSTYATVEIKNADDPKTRLFVGFVPTGGGKLLVYAGASQDGKDKFFNKMPRLSARLGVEVEIQRGRRIATDGRLLEHTFVRVRQQGTEKWTILHRSAVRAIGPPARWIACFGAYDLDAGGTIYFDAVRTQGLSGAGEDKVNADLMASVRKNQAMIMEALLKNLDLGRVFDVDFNPLSQQVQGLIDDLNSGIAKLNEARRKIRAGDFQSTTRVPQALRATRSALTFDQQAITAIRDGNFEMAIEAAVQAVEQTVRAGLFMRGHNPKTGPIRDGTGGFDDADPKFLDLALLQSFGKIFPDGYDAGDVNAWATSDP